MKGITNIAGGLAGALALNILHETVKHLDKDAPRVDLVGEEALSDIIKYTGHEPPKGKKLYAATLAGDIVSNALYYSAIGLGNKKDMIWRGAGYGLMAGAGAVFLTKPLGLNEKPVARTTKTKVLTATWYLFGGLVTALAIRGLKSIEGK